MNRTPENSLICPENNKVRAFGFEYFLKIKLNNLLEELKRSMFFLNPLKIPESYP